MQSGARGAFDRMEKAKSALDRTKIVSGIVSHNFAGHCAETLLGFAFQSVHDFDARSHRLMILAPRPAPDHFGGNTRPKGFAPYTSASRRSNARTIRRANVGPS